MKAKILSLKQITPPHICRLWVIVCVLLATHCNWAWGQGATNIDTLAKVVVFDQYGNVKKPSDMQMKTVIATCNVGMFTLHFDHELTTVAGVDDLAVRNVVCQVFTDLSALLAPTSNCSGASPNVDIRIGEMLEAEADVSPNYAAATSVHAVFRDRDDDHDDINGDGTDDFGLSTANGCTSLDATITPNNPDLDCDADFDNDGADDDDHEGILDSEVWHVINTGDNSLPYRFWAPAINTYDAEIRIRFSPFSGQTVPPTWYLGNANPIPTNTFDLYSVILHEAIHTLGFYSYLTFDGQGTAVNLLSLSNSPVAGRYYTRYDTHLHQLTNGGSLPLIVPTSNAGFMANPYSWHFNPAIATANTAIANTLLNSCAFDANFNMSPAAIVYQYNGANYPVYAPNVFSGGASLSHLHVGCSINGTATTTQYVMNWFASAGEVKRNITTDELNILCSLGYKILGTNNCDQRVIGINEEIDAANISSFGADTPPDDCHANYTMEMCPHTDGTPASGTITVDILANDAAATSNTNFTPTDAVGFELVNNVFFQSSGSAVLELTTSHLSTGEYDLMLSSPTPINYVGAVLIKYVPVDSYGRFGNVTYIEVWVKPCTILNATVQPCDGDGCNLFCNSNFNFVQNPTNCLLMPDNYDIDLLPQSVNVNSVCTSNWNNLHGVNYVDIAHDNLLPANTYPITMQYWLDNTQHRWDNKLITAVNIKQDHEYLLSFLLRRVYDIPMGNFRVHLTTDGAIDNGLNTIPPQFLPHVRPMTTIAQPQYLGLTDIQMLDFTSQQANPNQMVFELPVNANNQSTVDINVWITGPPPVVHPFTQVGTCFTATQNWNRVYFEVIAPNASNELSMAMPFLLDVTDYKQKFANLAAEYPAATVVSQLNTLVPACASLNVIYRWEDCSGNILAQSTDGIIPPLPPTSCTTAFILHRITSLTPHLGNNNQLDYVYEQANCPTAAEFDQQVSIIVTVPNPNAIQTQTLSNTHTYLPNNHPFGSAAGTAANPIQVEGDIILNPNANIILENLHFQMGYKARVIVTRNNTGTAAAKLRLHGCTFEAMPSCNAGCPMMWQGIQVWGPGEEVTQTTTNAAALFIEESIDHNPTVIKDAVIGIMTTRLDPQFKFTTMAANIQDLTFDDTDSDPNTNNTPSQLYINNSAVTVLPQIRTNPEAYAYGGGWLWIGDRYQTLFENCFYGVLIPHYHKAFLVPAANPGTTGYQIYSTHFNSTGLRFPFANLQTEVGIAGLNVNKAKILTNSNIFTNLVYGIRGNSTQFIKAGYSFFTDCNVGVSVQAPTAGVEPLTEVTGNTFSNCNTGIQGDGLNILVQENSINGTAAQGTVGVFLRGSFFKVGGTYNGNNYTGNALSNLNVGIATMDCSDLGNEIRNNTLSQVNTGIRAMRNNSGLSIGCNNINYKQYGVLVHSWNGVNGQIPDQGDCNDITIGPAFNTFSYSPTTPSSPNPRAIELNNAQAFTYSDINTTVNTLNILGISGIVTLDPCFGYNSNCNTYTLPNPLLINSMSTIGDKNEALSKWLRQYQADSNYTAAKQLLQQVATPMAIRKRIQDEYENEAYTTAKGLLDGMSIEKLEDQQFNDLQRMLINLKETGSSYQNLNDTQVETLLQMANSPTEAAYRAQAVLYMARGYEFPVILPNEEGNYTYSVFKTATNNALTNATTFSTLYPNPTKDQLFLDYALDNEQQATISLFDLNGRIVKQDKLTGNGKLQWLVDTLPSGFYYYQIQQNNETTITNKVIIIK